MQNLEPSSKIFIASSRIVVLPSGYLTVRRQSVTKAMPEVGPVTVNGQSAAIAIVIERRYHSIDGVGFGPETTDWLTGWMKYAPI
jgi:hypothetical protein